MIHGHVFAVGFYELVAHAAYIVDAQLSSSVRVKHGGLIDKALIPCAGGFNSEKLYVYIRLVHGRKLNGETSHMAGIYSVSVYEAGYLYAGVKGEIFY